MGDESGTGDELFDLPVGEFVVARDDLVRRLEDDGRADEAKRVRALRRPTLAAWAINQVVRADDDAWDDLVTAGQAMQRAQRRALSGIADNGLREASTTRRTRVERAIARAAQALEQAGARPDSHLVDVAATFEAASADPDVAERVGTGRLSAPVGASADFSSMTGLLSASLSVPAAGPEGGDDDDGVSGDDAARRRRDAIRALEAARTRATSSAATARRARRRADSLAGEAADATRAAEAARRAAEAASSRAEDLTARAATAQAAAVEARATADQDARAVAAADDDLDALA